ncbi:hypothetical protein K435DRAFT_846603 [Dendrothele bispora CBS 962.96]|uniref:Fatty acid hydroxylase domain-containing protein n=1 Tax=Dendrothele bispora (strain CBS 962.96) TaxID=1314807 RepID=A0A4S8KLG9_DENBC|nr:hypothetical protein K435DRAFT_846603 [Dendrothele bispora CBS 962.96]
MLAALLSIPTTPSCIPIQISPVPSESPFTSFDQPPVLFNEDISPRATSRADLFAHRNPSMSEVPPTSGPSSSFSSPSMTDVMALLAPNQQFMATLLAQQQTQSAQKTLEEPKVQLLMAMFIIDTLQYFLHRFMHVNEWFYKHFHSWHRRLYVPYAFGALYNDSLEGFALDSLSAALAECLTGTTTRQALVLFIVSTFKTVDDHCGYKLPFDPLQLMSGNNALP